MSYSSRGRKPIERASKIAHAELIKNPDVRSYIDQCVIPSAPEKSSLEPLLESTKAVDTSEILAVVAIDGGYTETHIREEYPSASIAFFTFGPLLFELDDLRSLENKRFIAPEDLARLKKIERYALVLPTRGVRRQDQPSLAATIRYSIYEFFNRDRSEGGEDKATVLL